MQKIDLQIKVTMFTDIKKYFSKTDYELDKVAKRFSSFEPDVVCSVSVIPLQYRNYSACMSFIRLDYHNVKSLKT